MSKLQCAFVGCGGVAERYWPIYRSLDFVEVPLCIDVDLPGAERAAAYFQKNSIQATVTADFHAALEPGIDIVVLNTPNHLHREQAIAALAAGKHVLLQKPIAATLDDAVAIVDAAAQARGRCGIYMSYLDQPLMYDLARMLHEGWFGEPVKLYGRVMHSDGMAWSVRAAQGGRIWRGSVEQTGGGGFVQLGVHLIHLFQWMTRRSITHVHGVMRNLHCPNLEGEDSASAILEFEGGVTATLDHAWCARGEELSIQGTKGSATYVSNRWLLLQAGAAPFTGMVLRANAKLEQLLEIPALSMGENHPLNQHRMFLEAIRDRKEPPVPVAAGLADMLVVRAFYESVETCARVDLKELQARLGIRSMEVPA
jgi:predicted dehydrogenase